MRRAMKVEFWQHSIPTNATTRWLLSACKYPRTPSFAAERHQPPANDDGGRGGPAATLADVDRFLFENFNSLYSSCDANDGGGEDAARGDYLAEGYCPSPPEAVYLPPGIRSTRRFFTSPGTSNSLLDEARASAASTTSSSYSDSPYSSSPTATASPRPSKACEMAPGVPGGSVAVTTFSKDPYEDFRRSMEEMVEARHVDPRKPLDWDFMEDLLISYLELNDHSVHKHILGAFTDLAVAFRRRRLTPWGHRGVPPPPSAEAKVGRTGRAAVAVGRGGVEGKRDVTCKGCGRRGIPPLTLERRRIGKGVQVPSVPVPT